MTSKISNVIQKHFQQSTQFRFSYDSVDKAMQDNPHTFDNIQYYVDKDSNTVSFNTNTIVIEKTTSGKFIPPRHDAS